MKKCSCGRMETTWAYAHLAKPPSLKRLSQPLITVAEKKYGMSAEKFPMFSKNFQESFQNGMTISPEFNVPNAL